VSQLAVNDRLSAPATVVPVAAVEFVRPAVAVEEVVAIAGFDVVVAEIAKEPVTGSVPDEGVGSKIALGVLYRLDVVGLPRLACQPDGEVSNEGARPTPSDRVPSSSADQYVVPRGKDETESEEIAPRAPEKAVTAATVLGVIRTTSQMDEVATRVLPRIYDIAARARQDFIWASAAEDEIDSAPGPKRVLTSTTEHVVGASPSRNAVSSAAATKPVVAPEAKDGVLPAESDNDVVAGSAAERVVPRSTDDRRSVATAPRCTRDRRCCQGGKKNHERCDHNAHGTSFPSRASGETRTGGGFSTPTTRKGGFGHLSGIEGGGG